MQQVKSNRIDLTDWIIHFVHRRNPDTDPMVFSIDPDTFERVPYPDRFSYDGEPEFLTTDYEEEEFGLSDDESAYVVLRKILQNGYIRAGWSLRNYNPTIYGPKAAVCFTEMPLYGLIQYAKNRNAEYFIEDYGIAFPRNELFSAGARPVIYGTSSIHKEAKKGDPYFGIGLRTLAQEVGIGLKEQYRYVATNISGLRRIDWTHEREWRWADIEDRFDDPGMPFFLKNDYFNFSKIIIIVKTDKEASSLIELLKTLYDAAGDDYGREYNVNTIQNSRVFSLEQLNNLSLDHNSIRLDDIPFTALPTLKKVVASNLILDKVKKAWQKASDLASAAASKFFQTEMGGIDNGPCGFANVVTYDAHSEVTAALVQLEIATPYAQKYVLYGLKEAMVQSLQVHEHGARTAAEYLTKELGQKFRIESRLD